jgi:hypothetical protein
MTGKQELVFNLTGDKALRNTMRKLSNAIQNRIAKAALTKAMRVVAKAQKAAAPHRILKLAIGMRVGQSKAGVETAKTGINVGKTASGKLNKKGKVVKGSQLNQIAHLLTTGTAPRYTGATTRARGRRGKLTLTGNKPRFTGYIRPHLFLKAASKSAWPKAVEIAGQSVWEDIGKLL